MLGRVGWYVGRSVVGEYEGHGHGVDGAYVGSSWLAFDGDVKGASVAFELLGTFEERFASVSFDGDVDGEVEGRSSFEGDINDDGKGSRAIDGEVDGRSVRTGGETSLDAVSSSVTSVGGNARITRGSLRRRLRRRSRLPSCSASPVGWSRKKPSVARPSLFVLMTSYVLACVIDARDSASRNLNRALSLFR